MALSPEQVLSNTPIRVLTDAEKHSAAISMAEVSLKRRWTQKYRDKQLRTVLAALGVDEP